MIGPWQVAIVAVVVVLLFGVGKLSGLGKDLGSSIKEFRRAMKEDEEEQEEQKEAPAQPAQITAPRGEEAPVQPQQQQQQAPPPENEPASTGAPAESSETANGSERRDNQNVF